MAEGIEAVALGVESVAEEVGEKVKVDTGDAGVDEIVERANIVINEPEVAVATVQEAAKDAVMKAQEQVQAGAQEHRHWRHDYMEANGKGREKSPDLDKGLEQEELIAAQIQSVCYSFIARIEN